MITVKTAELTGAQLDYAVGLANGYIAYPEDSVEQGKVWHLNRDTAPFGEIMYVEDYTPSTCWNAAVPIIEKHLHAFDHMQSKDRVCAIIKRADLKNGGWDYGYGPTVLIAAMRCYVTYKLGNEVEVPS